MYIYKFSMMSHEIPVEESLLAVTSSARQNEFKFDLQLPLRGVTQLFAFAIIHIGLSLIVLSFYLVRCNVVIVGEVTQRR